MTTSVVIYARVSTEEQATTGYSVGPQIEEAMALCKGMGAEVAAVFQESHSAKQRGRPEYRRMLAFLEEHPDVRTVVVHKFDRLSRNLEDVADIRRLGCRILSVKEPADNNPAGRLQENLLFSIAAFYSDNLSQEVSKGLRGKFEAGGLPGRAPIGYKNISRTRTKEATVVLDPDLAPSVLEAFERYATGKYSFASLAREAYELGIQTRTGRPLSQGQMQWLLQHPFYRGQTVFKGETRPGNHEALIGKALAARVDQVMAARSRDAGEKGRQFFLLRGLLRCAVCQRRLTAENHPKGSYYRCLRDPRQAPCSQRYVPVASLNHQVEALLPKLALKDETKAAVLGHLKTMATTFEATRKRDTAAAQREVQHAQSRLLTLTDKFVSGTIPELAYTRLRDETQRALTQAEARLERLDRDLGEDVRAVGEILDKASSLHRLYELASTPEQKKELLRQVFETIWVRDRTIASINYRSPFHLLLNDTRARPSEAELPQELLDAWNQGGWSAQGGT